MTRMVESPAPLLIHLDHPPSDTTVARENLVVAGWAFHPEQPVTAVQVGVDRELWVAARIGIARPDVAAAYPRHDLAQRAGWRAVLELTEWPREEIEITVVALCADRTAAWEMPARVRLQPPRLR